jgi:hypothetical protein
MEHAWLPWLLVAQGLVGGIDTLVNHEWIERLPERPGARGEIATHVVREAIYASLFGGLAWFAWHGALAWAIAALLGAEIIVTCTDEFIENRTRVLPQNERVLHVLLTLNLGVIIALLVPQLLAWSERPTAWVLDPKGAPTWLLSALAAVAAAWSLRDAVAWARLRR